MRSLRILLPVGVLSCCLVALGIYEFSYERVCMLMGPGSCYTTHSWSVRFVLLGGGVGLALTAALVGTAFLIHAAMRRRRSASTDRA